MSARSFVLFLVLLAFVLLTFTGPLLGSDLDPPSTGGIVELDRLLRRLETHRRLLVIGAHPDDEDSTLLALVARGLGGEAAYLSLSRGEGGQNLIGPELGVELGLLRSQELLAARRIDGARQFFTRAYDFGYTRSLEETHRLWPPEVLLEDAVRVVRHFKPQVIVSVFPPTGRAGHGQHQAAGVVARDVFAAAADPARFPQLLDEGLAPWKPAVLYQSARFRPSPGNLVLPTGGVDALTGQSYYQIAMASRSMHRSQDMGRLQTLGPRETRVDWRSGGAGAATEELFAGVDTSLAGMASTLPRGEARQALEELLAAAQALFFQARRETSPASPGAGLESLVEGLRLLGRAREKLKGSPLEAHQRAVVDALLEEKSTLAERAVAIAAGVAVDAVVEREFVVSGETVDVETLLYNAGGRDMVARAELVSPRGWLTRSVSGEAQDLASGQVASWRFPLAVPPTLPATVPYFLENPLQGALYDWRSVPATVRTRPFAPPPLVARFHLQIEEAPIVLERAVVYRYADQAVGEIRRPLRTVPRLEVEVSPALMVWPLEEGAGPRSVEIALTSHDDSPVAGEVELHLPAGWPAAGPVPFRIQEGGGRLVLDVAVEAPPGLGPGRYEVRVAALVEGKRFELAVPAVDYDHIHPVAAPRAARIEVHAASIRFPELAAVGYIRGASDRVPEFLAALDLPLHLLSPRDLAQDGAQGLSRFDAIIVGSRAYETDPHLLKANHRLLDYARDGGLLIVQYQQYQFVRGNYAPYPLEIGRPHDRVTDETAAVSLLEPDHPALTRPNRIGADDWTGWVQERGLYFPHTWDPSYTPLLEMADPGGPPLRGALLVASLGKGTYVYTGLALFRQLPAGVPGAYRLLANLLALGE